MERTHVESEDGLVDGKTIDDRLPEPASATRFARDFDIPSILPYTYYALVGIKQTSDWDLFRKGDDVNAVLSQGLLRTARWRTLDGTDFMIMLRLREFVAEGLETILSSDLRAVEALALAVVLMSQECTKRADCTVKMHTTMLGWRQNSGFLTREVPDIINRAINPDPLGQLDRMLDSNLDWEFCSSCRRVLQAHIRSAQSSIWTSLPQFLQMIFNDLR